MKEWAMRELGFGEILDVIFQTVKSNLKGMLLITFLFFAPAVVIQLIGLQIGSFAIIFLSSIIFMIAYFLAMASVMLIVRDVRQEKDWNLREIARQARSRFWPLLGASILFGLLVFAIVLVLILIFGIFGGSIAGLAMVLGGGSVSPGVGILGAFGVFIMTVVFFVVYIFLMVRFSFYFPAVVFGESPPALSRSWRLTQNNVWRLIGLYIVITLFMLVIVMGPIFLLAKLSIPLVLTRLVQAILDIIYYVFYAAAMAVVYFDLVVRNEAGDLLDLTARYENAAPAHPANLEPAAAQAELHADASPEDKE
ncbi:MAG: hypothetical protein FWC60_11310 [Firmicutes bacterium]|nr:hypothetical protein [Bacillota bacterium]